MAQNMSKMLNQLQFKLDTTNFTNRIGFLDEENADRFINLTIDQSSLLSKCRIERVSQRAGEFPTFELPYPVTRRRGAPIPEYQNPRNYEASGQDGGQGLGYENETYSGETGTYSVGAIKYSCNKIVTHFKMSWEQLNWNIEGTDFENMLVGDWSKALRRDMELLALRGDSSTALAQSLPADYWNHLYRIDDGWITILNDANQNVIDWVDNDGNPKAVDHTLFQAMRAALPSRWVDENLYWIGSPRLSMDYIHYLSDRGDALGAAMLMGAQEPRPEGIPFLNGQRGIPYMPETADNGDTLTNLLLCNPQRLWMLIHREFRLETDRDAFADNWWWIGHGYLDFIVDFPAAVVMAKNVKYATIEYGASPS